MTQISKEALLRISYRAGEPLEFKGRWVRKKNDTRWHKWTQMHQHLNHLIKKRGSEIVNANQ